MRIRTGSSRETLNHGRETDKGSQLLFDYKFIRRNDRGVPWGPQPSSGPLEITVQGEQWPSPSLCDLAETGHEAWKVLLGLRTVCGLTSVAHRWPQGHFEMSKLIS